MPAKGLTPVQRAAIVKLHKMPGAKIYRGTANSLVQQGYAYWHSNIIGKELRLSIDGVHFAVMGEERLKT